LTGLDIYVLSNVPKGSGISSSAAYEVLIGTILNELCMGERKISAIEIAQIGQWAENVYFGKPCGLMDQMASSVGGIVTIDFANPAQPVVQPVELDFSKAGLALCILDSGADHADLTEEYAAIPGECKAVARVCGAEVLRDVPYETFLSHVPECRKCCGDRAVMRTFHFYEENERVVKQVAALQAGDFDGFLRLVQESGQSSWEYLQNVIPAGYTTHQDMAVAIAVAKQALRGTGAVRVHGGGFAGTIQAFVPLDMLETFRAEVEAVLGAGSCHVLSIRPVGGTCL
jgi:galactokinase